MNGRPLLNQRIVANAGSGKTYRLATRYIELLARGVPPERIIALTFTRKAAGEFLDAIFARLLAATQDESAARRLAGETGFPALRSADFLAFLRLLVEHLPHLALGTLDGFFGRIIRVFPFECGLAGEISLLDPRLQDVTRRSVLAAVFRAHASNERSFRELLELLRRQSRNRQARSVAAVLDAEIRLLHEKYLLTPEGIVWGDPATVWGREEPEGDAALLPQVLANFRQALFDLHPGMAEKHRLAWEDRLDAIARLRPGADVPRESAAFAIKALSPGGSKLPGHFELKVGNKPFAFPDSLLPLVHALGAAIIAIDRRTRLERSRALHQLVARFEHAYRRNVREAGRLTFLDITGMLAASQGLLWAGGSLHSYMRQAIDYRLDAAYDHWLLDEFQDTSRLQWQALHSLVDEVIQSDTGRRSFFYVGDTKQAIYSWRGGDPRLFDEIAAYYNASGENRIDTSESLATSYRSVPEILDGVNLLFAPDHLAGLAVDMEFPGEVIDRWRSAWRTHVPARPEPGRGCFSWRTFSGEAGAELLDRETASLIASVDPVRRGWTCAVLVHTNKRIGSIVNALRSVGVPAAAEGRLFPCVDNDLSVALLDLLRFIVHPADRLSGCHAGMTPLRALIASEAFRRDALRDIRRDGLPAALRLWMERLDLALNDFQRSRLETFIEAAAEFDATSGRAAPLDEFIEFAENYAATESASGASVRVMTMHAAKGLDFDMVVLPEIEGVSLPSRRDESSIHLHLDRSGVVDWGMELPPRAVCDLDPVLSAAYAGDVAEDCYEKIALYYVALTRPRRALYLLSSAQKEDSRSHDFNRLLHLSFPEALYESGNPLWYEDQALPPAAEPDDVIPAFPPSTRAGEPSSPGIVMPSRHDGRRLDAGALFPGGVALSQGNETHALLARVRWLEDLPAVCATATGAAGEILRSFASSLAADCLRRPAGECRLWIEKSFDLVLGGRRVSGVIDRAVLRADGAELYDFKTDEGDPSRILDRHRGQMALYRACLAALTGLPEAAIAARIVCVRSGVMLDVP